MDQIQVEPYFELALKNMNSAQFGGLIVTIVTTIAFPFIQQHPLVFYSVSSIPSVNKNHLETWEIKLDNYGITQANNVLISLKLNNVKFVSFNSEPYLMNNLVTNLHNSNQSGQGFFVIKVLPAQTEVIIRTIANTSLVSPNQKLIPYAQSDQWITYDTSYMSTIVVLYSVVLSAFIIIFIILWKKIHLSPVLFILTIIYAIVVSVLTNLPLQWKFVLGSILIFICVMSVVVHLRRPPPKNLSYYCMGCGTKHNQTVCPKCGNKFKRVGP